MQDTARRNVQTRKKSRIKKKRKRTGIFVISCIICIITSITIMVKSRFSNNVRNNGVASSGNKVNQNQVNVGSYKNGDNPVKSDQGNIQDETGINLDDKATVQAEGKTNLDNEANAKHESGTNSDNQMNNSSNTQVSSQGNNQINNQGISAEQSLVNDGKKTAFLTFDDGPSVTVTPKILDILKEYKVNGTFFVVGSSLESNEKSKEILKRSFEEGNAIGNHSYSHSLKVLYPNNKVNVDVFMAEVDKTNNILRSVLGQGFNTRIIRMPGGYMSRQYYRDPNLPAFDAKLKERNMCSIDWNAYDADAEGGKKSAAQLLDEVKKTVSNKEKVVILMHDTYGKEETAKALPQIIEYLKSEGYEFKTLK